MNVVPARLAIRPARREAPAPAPAPTRRARPDLRVIIRTGRSTRFRVLTAAGIAVVFTLLFGLVLFHTVLVQNQQRLDQLTTEVAQEQARHQRLRLEVARLSSPERIVEEAMRRGMVRPPGTTYLQPAPASLQSESAT